MIVVIFRARVKNYDVQYSETAARMRDLACREFGCLSFYSVTEGQEEITLSYWPDEQSIQAWRSHPEHLEAQRLGQNLWYDSYAVEVASVVRQYQKTPIST